MATVALARNAMNTRFEVVLHRGDPVALRAVAEEALDEVERLEAQLSLYRATSELTHLNARAASGPVRVEPQLFRLLLRARQIWEATGGAFDITVAPLMRCWGFVRNTGKLPDPEELAEARACVGMPFVELNEAQSTVRFARPGVILDLGAIGKGHALERAERIIREAGVASAILHGGTSTVCAIGRDENDRPWKIAIAGPSQEISGGPTPGLRRSAGAQPARESTGAWPQVDSPPGAPASDPAQPLPRSGISRTDTRAARDEGRHPGPSPNETCAVVELENESLSVSAVWGKAFTTGGKIYGHVLDPRTGEPANRAVLAAVVGPSATDTDALSTALLTLGEPGLDLIASQDRPSRALVIANGDQYGEFHVATKGIEINSV